jgi:hypothetical protein
MKFYYRYPDRALSGMSELNAAQRGIYNSIIDLIYARDGVVPCQTPADDNRIAKNISVNARTWRAYKKQLLAIGKIRITPDGCLTANGCQEGLFDAVIHSETQAKRARNRWENYRLRNKLNGPIVPHGTANNIDIDTSVLPSPLEHAKPPPVDNGDNDFGNPDKSTKPSAGSAELKAALRAKGWIA